MIPRAHIVEWRASAPWLFDAQVEQDLIICRALVSLFSLDVLRREVAFRGGTALHKLYLHPASRYSEDIDLVQVNAGPAGPIMDAIQEVLNPILGAPRRIQKGSSVALTYRTESEIPPVQPLQLKIEVNTREHFSVFGFAQLPFGVQSRWFSGKCRITTYSLDELLSTKLRALYQRRKGRDLYDLWLGLTKGAGNAAHIVDAFQQYMKAEGLGVSQREFRSNLSSKMKRKDFLGDTSSLLKVDFKYDPQEAFNAVDKMILGLLI